MLSIKWSDEIMSVGIEEIDSQHKRLIDLINKIIHSIEDGNQIKNIEIFIEDATAYTKYHFSSEEKYFEKSCKDKDQIKKHKIRHQEFIDKVNEFGLRLKNNNDIRDGDGIELVTQLNKYLSGWLVNHIIVEDRGIFKKNKS